MKPIGTRPLVSIIALSYKENIMHLIACLESIFSQTYDNIELILSNDGAGTFDEAVVKDLVDKYRNDNIKNIVINKNEENIGTVKHCNLALELSNGDYVMFIACDDVYSNNDVIKNMVEGFNLVPSDTMAIVGQTAMYDEDLNVCKELFVKKATQRLINELSPQEFYRKHLSTECLLPAASIIYKREVFDKYGRFDEKYFLIEDYSFSISSTKQGMKYYYLDIMCVSHRDGGASHSEADSTSFADKMFQHDSILILEELINDKSLDEDVLKKVNARLRIHKQIYSDIFEKPLVSIIALSYKENIMHLIVCLESIFSQTYDNIEIILTNDGADTFDEAIVKELVDKNKKDNIKNIVINKNKENLGTVKSCNIALNLSSGDYIMFIACDDVYSNNDVIKSMIEGFNLVPSDTMAIVGQTAMYDEDLNVCKELFVKKVTQRLINDLSPQEFYKNHLSVECLLPAASIIYKRKVFEKFGKFDERFFLIEDYSFSISSTKQGMKYYYLDIMCVSHRDGGVSHSEADSTSFANKMFQYDSILILEELINDKSLDEDVLKKVNARLRIHKQIYSDIFEKPDRNIFNIPSFAKTVEKLGVRANIIFTLNRMLTLCVFAFIFFAIGVTSLNNNFLNISYAVWTLLIYFGLFMLALVLLLILLKSIMKLYFFIRIKIG